MCVRVVYIVICTRTVFLPVCVRACVLVFLLPVQQLLLWPPFRLLFTGSAGLAVVQFVCLFVCWRFFFFLFRGNCVPFRLLSRALVVLSFVHLVSGPI